MPFSQQELEALTQTAITAAEAAAEIIRTHYRKDIVVDLKVRGDSLASQVVTEVDRLAQAAILEIIAPISEACELAILAEESADSGDRLHKRAFWSIDPLDGTLAFIEGRPEFAVSIALVTQSGEPLIGVVIDPVTGDRFEAFRGSETLKNGCRIDIPSLDDRRPLVLRTDPSFQRHRWFELTRAALQMIAKELGLQGAEIQYAAGSVMTACRILEDANVCYFKYARRGESGGSLWDYAATSCLFQQSVAVASDIYGRPMALNRPESTFMNHRGILYSATKQLANEIILLNRRLEQST